mmetsp:Transcript_37438/g.43707  ORF Transcript_37438/g.43707 Transcript_37438/m.43707 type:complete len:207 (-) Transcript_37438:68-688(-)
MSIWFKSKVGQSVPFSSHFCRVVFIKELETVFWIVDANMMVVRAGDEDLTQFLIHNLPVNTGYSKRMSFQLMQHTCLLLNRFWIKEILRVPDSAALILASSDQELFLMRREDHRPNLSEMLQRPELQIRVVNLWRMTEEFANEVKRSSKVFEYVEDSLSCADQEIAFDSSLSFEFSHSHVHNSSLNLEYWLWHSFRVLEVPSVNTS